MAPHHHRRPAGRARHGGSAGRGAGRSHPRTVRPPRGAAGRASARPGDSEQPSSPSLPPQPALPSSPCALSRKCVHTILIPSSCMPCVPWFHHHCSVQEDRRRNHQPHALPASAAPRRLHGEDILTLRFRQRRRAWARRAEAAARRPQGCCRPIHTRYCAVKMRQCTRVFWHAAEWIAGHTSAGCW